MFTNFWLYIGQYSGQLQTIIGIIAIIIGIFAPLYARKQIAIANHQREDSLKLAKFDLQLKLLETAYDCEKEIAMFKQ